MRSPSFLSTTNFRWALTFAAAFSGGMLILAIFIYWQTVGYLNQRFDRELVRDAREIASEGPHDRIELIGRYLDRGGGVLRIAGLFGPSRQPVAGNLESIPNKVPRSGAIATIQVPIRSYDRVTRERVRLTALSISGGDVLVLGRSPVDFDEINEIVTHALTLAGLPAVFLALIAGWLLSRGTVSRIAEVHRATRLIISGKLDERLPTRGTQDELDKLARIVNDMLDEIERLMMEAKGVGEDIAHDLRTPLTRLRARIERVAEALPRDGEAGSSLLRAIDDIDQILITIRAILRIAEVEDGQRRSGFREVDLNDVVREAVDLYEPIAETKGIELNFCEVQTGSTIGDADLLFEAVSNLLDNAIKFTPADGKVQVLIHRGSGGTAIRITDTGPGIAPGKFPEMLQRFRRGEQSRGAPGTGLGLSLVASIVRLHKFALALHDDHDGCCIELQCWVQEPAPAAARA